MTDIHQQTKRNEASQGVDTGGAPEGPGFAKAGDRPKGSLLARVLSLLLHDRFALGAMVYLLVLFSLTLAGPHYFAKEAKQIHLRARNTAPFSLEKGPMYMLGSDILG